MFGGKGLKRAERTAEIAESSMALLPLDCTILAAVTLPAFVRVKRTTQTALRGTCEAGGVCQAAWMADNISPW